MVARLSVLLKRSLLLFHKVHYNPDLPKSLTKETATITWDTVDRGFTEACKMYVWPVNRYINRFVAQSTISTHLR